MGRTVANQRATLAAIASALVGALCALCAALAPSALAADQFEPNDSQAKATKMKPGKTYEADIDKLDDAINQNKGDVDWYSLNAAAGQISIAYTALQTQSSCFGPEARLIDASGQTLGTAQPAKGNTERIKYTAPADAVLYLRVQQYQIDTCNAPMPYRLAPEFTEATGGGGGGSIQGLKIKAKKTQRQKGKRIKVKVKVGADEPIETAAKGTIKLGKKRIRLTKDAAAPGAGTTATLTLSVKRRATSKKIVKAIAKGKRVVADVEVAAEDADDNGRAKSLLIRLR